MRRDPPEVVRTARAAGARAGVVVRLVVAVGLLLAAACAPPQSRNVVLLVVDTLRADHLGIYGYDRPTSPHIDAWSQSGAVFDNAFATSPWTLPSFASLLSGLLPSDHGAGWPVDLEAGHYLRTRLAEEVEPLPLTLSRAGWKTAAFAGNPFVHPDVGLGRGFDDFFYEADAKADRVVDGVLAWLGGLADERFFVMVHFMDPHMPYRAPERFLGRFSEGEPRGLMLTQRSRWDASLIPARDREYLIGRYDEEIAFLDEQVGRLLAALDEVEDTLVVLTADHGEELFEHGGFEHGHSMMQELLRVPLVVVGPGVEARRIAVPVTIADIAPTVLDATGLEGTSSGPAVGRSLWPLLETAGSGGHETERLLWAESILYGAEQKVLVRWPHKLVLDMETGERRLFDLSRDPAERRDLSVERSDLAERMKGVLLKRLAETGGARGEALLPDETTRRELEALGYVD